MSYVSAMDVKEYTLYQKWCEVKDRYPTVETNSFFDDKPAMLKPEQGVEYSYKTDSLLVLQRRSTLLEARKELAKTTNYYDFWKSSNKT